MRKAAFLLFLLLIPTSLFAQYTRGRGRYRDTPRDNAVELTPFLGYRYGGTLFADQSDLFREDVDLKSSADVGALLGLPLGDSGLKLELLISHQRTELESGGGLFNPTRPLADIDVTYYQAGVLVPFARSRNATPFMSVTAGIANLDPKVRGADSENRFSASAGVGVKVPFSRNIGLRFEARGYYTSTGNNNRCSRCGYGYDYNHDLYQGETNLGLMISF